MNLMKTQIFTRQPKGVTNDSKVTLPLVNREQNQNKSNGFNRPQSSYFDFFQINSICSRMTVQYNTAKSGDAYNFPKQQKPVIVHYIKQSDEQSQQNILEQLNRQEQMIQNHIKKIEDSIEENQNEKKQLKRQKQRLIDKKEYKMGDYHWMGKKVQQRAQEIKRLEEQKKRMYRESQGWYPIWMLDIQISKLKTIYSSALFQLPYQLRLMFQRKEFQSINQKVNQLSFQIQAKRKIISALKKDLQGLNIKLSKNMREKSNYDIN